MPSRLVANDAQEILMSNYFFVVTIAMKVVFIFYFFQLVILGLSACQAAWALEKQGEDFDSYLRGELMYMEMYSYALSLLIMSRLRQRTK